MPVITREDGQRFVIPSYRDTISTTKPALLKRELTSLSASYGEYVAIQKKSATEYEVALSQDAGYLLGECVWHYFKRPYDMIYCEEISNTGEAILVIVKGGSVYLDGSFSLDSIVEELLIFKTQQNNFDIYIHGNVPISQTLEPEKFNLDASSVKHFEVLPEPVFPTLPPVKAFQLKLVDDALKEFGIGVLPLKKIILGTGALIVAYLIYLSATEIKEVIPVSIPIVVAPAASPYQAYIEQLSTPDPAKQIRNIVAGIYHLYSVPGWRPATIDFTQGLPGSPGRLKALMISDGAKTQLLLDWAHRNNAIIDIQPDGIYVTLIIFAATRSAPDKIYSLQSLLAAMIDRISYVVPGNTIQFTALVDRKTFSETNLSMNLSGISPFTLDIISQSIEELPLVLTKLNFTFAEGTMSGIITFKALGN